MDLSHSLRKRCSVIRDLALGLPEHRFWNLFVQCSLCKTVVLREPFSAFHDCSSRQQTQSTLSRFTRALSHEDVGSDSDGEDTDAVEGDDDSDIPEPASDTEPPTALDALFRVGA